MKANYYFISLLIFILNISFVQAQTYEIKGKVSDTKSKESMIGVHIKIKDDVHGTITGNEGTFNLKHR